MTEQLKAQQQQEQNKENFPFDDDSSYRLCEKFDLPPDAIPSPEVIEEFEIVIPRRRRASSRHICCGNRRLSSKHKSSSSAAKPSKPSKKISDSSPSKIIQQQKQHNSQSDTIIGRKEAEGTPAYDWTSEQPTQRAVKLDCVSSCMLQCPNCKASLELRMKTKETADTLDEDDSLREAQDALKNEA